MNFRKGRTTAARPLFKLTHGMTMKEIQVNKVEQNQILPSILKHCNIGATWKSVLGEKCYMHLIQADTFSIDRCIEGCQICLMKPDI